MTKWQAIVAVVAFAAVEAAALTPDEAYAAIPHRRIAYDPATSTLSKVQADNLKRLFALSDQAVVLRVEGMRAVRAADAAVTGHILAQYDTVLVGLRGLDLAPEIRPARGLVVDAVNDHRRFLASKRGQAYSFASNELHSAPDVKQASGKLQRAYGLLMQAFPKEAPRNKEAFFDHLCALDYL